MTTGEGWSHGNSGLRSVVHLASSAHPALVTVLRSSASAMESGHRGKQLLIILFIGILGVEASDKTEKGKISFCLLC